MTGREKQIAEMANVIPDMVQWGGTAYDLTFGYDERDRVGKKKAIAKELVDEGYRLCGGDGCPNYKHYKADCAHCVQVMEIRQTMLIEIAKKQAVKSLVDKIKGKKRDIVYQNGIFTVHGVGVSLTDIDKAVAELDGADKND